MLHVFWLICELFWDAELKLLHAYQTTHIGDRARILAVGLSSRKNLCVNSRVLAAENRDSVDASCRRLTASWVRAAAAANPNLPTCEFFEEYEKAGSNAVLPPGVYTLQVEMNWNFCVLIDICVILAYGVYTLRVEMNCDWFVLVISSNGWSLIWIGIFVMYMFRLICKLFWVISKEHVFPNGFVPCG